jgi:phosphoglycerate dehydrogenase-like enzyme
VAEQALALTLGLLRNLKVASLERAWTHTEIRPLAGSSVLIIGGGGIGETLARHLIPFGARITVVRRQGIAVSWADRTLTMEALRAELPMADVVYLAVPLTDELEGLIGAAELRAMQPTAILINVARGRHVVTDDLVLALRGGWIAGAGLDVTDPEPLPDGHPLWDLPNCIITSHSSNSTVTYRAGLSARIAANVERYRSGRELLGVVVPSKRY